jgi:hypothetical protein
VVEVSDLAVYVLVQSLKSSGIEPEKGFRLKKEEDGFRLDIDSPAESDHVIRHEGAIVMMVDQGTQAQVGNVLVDVKETTDGRQLTVSRIGTKPWGEQWK